MHLPHPTAAVFQSTSIGFPFLSDIYHLMSIAFHLMKTAFHLIWRFFHFYQRGLASVAFLILSINSFSGQGPSLSQ